MEVAAFVVSVGGGGGLLAIVAGTIGGIFASGGYRREKSEVNQGRRQHWWR